MKEVQLHDKRFAISIDAAKIDKAVQNVADKINIDYKDKNPLFLVVLNGAFLFASDLLKKVTIECEISFVKLSSYSGTTSNHVVRELIGLDEALTNRNVIVVGIAPTPRNGGVVGGRYEQQGQSYHERDRLMCKASQRGMFLVNMTAQSPGTEAGYAYMKSLSEKIAHCIEFKD